MLFLVEFLGWACVLGLAVFTVGWLISLRETVNRRINFDAPPPRQTPGSVPNAGYMREKERSE